MLVGAGRFELPASWSRTKRATGLRYAPIFMQLYQCQCPERCALNQAALRPATLIL
jgi:hypothetical protein